MEEKREQNPVQEQDEKIETVQESAQEPVQETAQTEEQQTLDEAQQIFDAEADKQPQEKCVYKWNYEDQRAADLKEKKTKRGIGVWIYALLATAAFALCLGLVVGMLLFAVVSQVVGGEQESIEGGFTGDVTIVGGGDEQTIQLSALESVRNYTVVITAKDQKGVNTGTGFVLTEDGYIATNYHVVEGAQTITVKLYNGQAAVAELVGYSEIDDIAVIKIEARGLYVAKLGSSADVQDAQNVYAVGTPAGEEYAWSVTKGIVSFAQRDVKIYDDEGILIKKMKLIQTDTPVNPGNSGGPLVNSDGEVLGIITLKLSGQYENMGFAIPIDGAMVLINNIIETGEPGESPITSKRPLIGIVGGGVEPGKYYHAMNEKQEEIPGTQLYADRAGVMVLYLTPGLDAANKLQVGDIIVMAEGRELLTIYDLMDVINEHNGGDTIELTLYRNGLPSIVKVELGYAE